MLPGRRLRTRLFRFPASFCKPFHSSPVPCFSARSSDETYAWNLAIAGNLRRKNPGGAVSEYARMRKNGIVADSHTLGFLVKGCGCRAETEQSHCHAVKMGFSSEVIVQTALLSSYGLLGEVRHARTVFDETLMKDLPLWNAMLAAYSRQGRPLETLQLAGAMVEEGLRLNAVTASSIISACSALKDLCSGKLVHGFVLKTLLHHDTVLCSALLSFYARCGALLIARRLFDEMPSRDLVAWTAMIGAYTDNERPSEALSLFKDMAAAGVPADEVTILSAAAAGRKLQDLNAADFIEDYARRQGLADETRVANALMLMHARCGNIRRACEIFGAMAERTEVSWTTIIQALAMHGRGKEVLLRFSQMQIAGVAPDELCFVSVLSGCNRSGMVEEARSCFRAMAEERGLTPWIEHCASMVDLLCREGLLEEALGFLARMPMKPDERMMRVFFKACERLGRPELWMSCSPASSYSK